MDVSYLDIYYHNNYNLLLNLHLKINKEKIDSNQDNFLKKTNP